MGNTKYSIKKKESNKKRSRKIFNKLRKSNKSGKSGKSILKFTNKQKQFFNVLRESNILLIFLVNKFVILNDKQKIINLLKSLRDKKHIIHQQITNDELIEFHMKMLKYIPTIVKHMNKYNMLNKNIIIKFNENNKGGKTTINKTINKTSINKIIKKKGGAFLKRLEDKGNDPITGAEFSQALDEISDVLQRIIYTPRGSKLKPFNTLLNIFRGNKEALDMYLRYSIIPEFASVFPLKLNIGKVLTESTDLINYLNAYYTYKNYIDNYKVETGELKPSDIKSSQFEKMIENLTNAKMNYQMMQMKMNPKMMAS